jgi:hypothetical protein
MLRPALLVLGLVALGAALTTGLAGAPLCVVVWTALIGALLVGGMLFERGRYKPAERGSPGPDWVTTGEHFVDPGSGETVTVFYQPSTGERRYVSRQAGG